MKKKRRRKYILKRHRWSFHREDPAWPEDTEYMISRALELKDTREMSENAR